MLPNAPCASERARPFLSSLPLWALCKLGNPMLPWVSLLSLGNLGFFLSLFLLISSILGLRLSYLAPLAAHVCMQVIWSDCTRWRRHAHTLAQNNLCEFWCGMHLTCNSNPITPDRNGSVIRPEKVRKVPIALAHARCKIFEADFNWTKSFRPWQIAKTVQALKWHQVEVRKFEFALKNYLKNRHAGSWLSRWP